MCYFPLLQYTPENVPGPGCSSDPSEITLPGCQCHSLSCQSDKCQCLQKYGPAYSDQQRLLDRKDEEIGYSRPVFECNALCDCSDDCSNRLVQRGVGFRLRVFPSEDRGWGVRAMEAIPCGAFVCEYAGEVIGLEEALNRQLAQGPKDMNYIIAVREHTGQGKARETFVDPFARGNVGRFINHSCQPNLFMVPVRVHSMVPRLALFAVQDIVPDEELTFDYSGKYNNQVNSNQNHLSQESDPGESVDPLQRKPCYCGALNCTGYLPLDITVLHSEVLATAL